MRLPSKRLFWAVSLGHTTNDIFMSMRSVLLAFISAYVLPMSNRQIGLAISAGELVGAFSQPFFGWLADKTGGRWVGALGVAWTVSGIMIAMLVVAAGGSYWLMLIPLALAALGSGAFHPVGSMHAAESDKLRAASNTAIFFMFGQVGLGLGPALAGLLLNNAHTRYNDLFGPALGPAFKGIFIESGSVTPVLLLWLLVIPAPLLMALVIPSRRHEQAAQRPAADDGPARLSLPMKALLILAMAVLLRSLANPATVSFIPRLFQLKGWSPAEYGLLTSSFWIASGVAGVLFGYLANRFDLRFIITGGLALASPAIFLLPALGGGLAFVLAIVIGALSGGSHSLIVVLAQALMPGRKGLASGAILGFIFATGAVGNLIIGDLADRIGAAATFQVIGVVTLAASFLWLALPAPKKQSAAPSLEGAARRMEKA
ncbi:MAG: MFS transporter [Chloroflexi bacterium]|nr:MFS transporter [Chloroflexota bacterium]